MSLSDPRNLSSALWVCWKPPQGELGGEDRLLSFLSPSQEEALEQRYVGRLVRAREVASQVRAEARRRYLQIVARLGLLPVAGGRTLRQALARPGEASRWWYHPVADRDCETDPTFNAMIAIQVIQAVAQQQSLTHLVLVGAPAGLSAVLRSGFVVEGQLACGSPSLVHAGVIGIGSRLRFLVRMVRDWAAARRWSRPPAGSFTVVLSGFWNWSVWWDDRTATLTDRYFKQLPQELQRYGISSVGWWVWLDAHPQPGHRRPRLQEWLRPLAGRQDVVVLQALLRLPDLLRAVGDWQSVRLWLAVRRSPAARAVFDDGGLNYRALFDAPLLRGLLDASLPHRDLVATATARAAARSRPRLYLSFLEHVPYARASYDGIRRAGQGTICCAIQHASYSSDKTFVLLEPSLEFRGEPDGCAVPHPHTIFAMGTLGAELFQSCGYAPERVVVTGSPRYDHVRAPVCAPADGTTALRPRRELRVLVALGLSVELEVQMLDAVCAAVQGLDDVRVMVRNHPFSRIERHPAFTRLQPSVTITQDTLDDDLAQADVVVFTYSTVAEEAFLQGKAVWQWLPSGFNGSALAEAVDIPQFGSVEALRRALLAYRADPRPFLPSATASKVALTRLFYQGDGGAAQRIAAKVAELCPETVVTGQPSCAPTMPPVSAVAVVGSSRQDGR